MSIRATVGRWLENVGYTMRRHTLRPGAPPWLDVVDKNAQMLYDAASTARHRYDWGTSTDTPYNDIKPDLPTLIARSRESVANNGLSDAIDNVFISNVVHTGIKPEPAVESAPDTLDERTNAILAEGWKRYNDQWDRTGKSTYYECQALQLATIINTGSALRNTVRAPKGSFLPIANQLIEADRLDFTFDTFNRTNITDDAAPAKQTQFGIELDEYGVPLRFHVKGITEAIQAEQMDIRFRRRRTEQYIGVPWKAPILAALWDVESLCEDKLMQSRIQAMIGLWVHKDDMPMFVKNADSKYRIKWEPARIMYSRTKPEPVETSEKVTDTFQPMTRLIQRSIAVGCGLSYQILTKDLEGMNFASSRANILEDRRTFQLLQKWFIKEVCQRDWEIFVKWMFLSGKMAPLTYADYKADPWKWGQAYWQPPGWDWVDPLKDAQTAIQLHENNMQTLKDYYGSRGQNWIAELRQLEKEKTFVKELGIEVVPKAKPGFPPTGDDSARDDTSPVDLERLLAGDGQ